MAALADDRLDVARLAAHRDHADRHVLAAALHLGRAGRAARFDDAVFDAALGAVEGNVVALPGVIGRQRVVQVRAVVVADHHVHGVFDVDARAPHALVAVVAVVALVVEVEGFQARVRGQVEVEIALLLFRAGQAALVRLGEPHAARGFRGVELARTEGVHGLRLGAQPPVDQVEVVGRLVHHQAARIGLVGVPAAEVIGAVDGVEQPGEVDRDDVADLARHQELLDLGARRGIAVVEGDTDLAAGALDGVDDTLCLVGGGRHRLFGDDVAAGFEGAHDVVVVSGVGRGDDHILRPGFADHAVEVRRGVAARLAGSGLGDELHGARQASGILVADAHDFGGSAELARHRIGEHARTRTHAHHRIALARGRREGAAGSQHQASRPGALQYGAAIDSPDILFIHAWSPVLLWRHRRSQPQARHMVA